MDSRILQVEDYIRKNLDQHLKMDELSEIACMSPKHFQRKFKCSTGITPGTYVEIWKVKKSLELLKGQNQVREIAAAFGYWNYETFSRVFKKYCRIAPSELQFLIRVIQDNTESDAPAVISLSRNPDHLSALVGEAIDNNIFSIQSLDALQVCIIRKNSTALSSRRIEDKYSISFDEEIIPDILNQIKK